MENSDSAHHIRKALPLPKQLMPLFAVDSSNPGVALVQRSDRPLCGRTYVARAPSIGLPSGVSSRTAHAARTVPALTCMALHSNGTCSRVQQKTCSFQASTTTSISGTPESHLRSSSKVSTEVQNQLLALQLHKVTLQLRHQQKMAQLLMKQVQKEQDRFHSMEDALLESCLYLGPCCTPIKR